MDGPYWRNVRFRIYTSYCKLEDLRSMDMSELADLLEKSPKTDITYKHYIYRYIPKSGIVQRIHVTDSFNGTSIREPEQEKHYNRWLPLYQTQLVPSKETSVK
jgi:hypothetical protein